MTIPNPKPMPKPKPNIDPNEPDNTQNKNRNTNYHDTQINIDEDPTIDVNLPNKLDDSTFVKFIVENPIPNPNLNSNLNNNDNNNQVMKLNSNAMRKITINPKTFEKKNILFNEREGIEELYLH